MRGVSGRAVRVLIAACIVLLVGGFVSAAGADAPAATPLAGFPAVNGGVYSMAVHGSTLYIGGDFTTVGPDTGSFASFATSNGSAATAPAFGCCVLAVASDRAGGWYVGGYFTSAGDGAHDYLVHVTASGALYPSFDPDPDNSVEALALSPDGHTLYVGGDFSTIGGQTRDDLAALNASNGSATSFEADANSDVDALALSADGNTLYAGGDFTMIGGDPRDSLAAVSASTGVVSSTFDPEPNGIVQALVPSSDGATVYVAGWFSSIGGEPYSYLAAVSTSDGTAVTAFQPNPEGAVLALAYDSSTGTLYAGGFFSGTSSIGGADRNYLAAVTTSTGAATSFDPDPNGDVYALALSGDGSTLYAGGYFTSIGGQSRSRLAALSTADSTASSGFDPGPNDAVYALGLSPDGSRVAAGGTFDGSTAQGAVTRDHLAAIDLNTDTVVASFDPGADDTVIAIALSPDGSTLYAGGFFQEIGGQARPDIAAINTSTGNLTPFDADANGPVYALALSPDGSTLYAGGDFNTAFGTPVIGGANRNYIAGLTTSTGTATDFDPEANQEVSALAVSPDGNTVYAGGSFRGSDSIGGADRNYIAGLNASNGSATAFDPDANDNVDAIAVSPDGSTVYAGGLFGTWIGSPSIGGADRSFLAALQASDGSATSFDPNPDDNVIALQLVGSTLYVGGEFQHIGTQTRHDLAAVDTSDGSVTSFDPEGDDLVEALAFDGTSLYAGGAFYQFGTTAAGELARFPSTPVLSLTAPPALTESTAVSVTFSSNEPGSSFLCKLDGGSFQPCTSPASYSGLSPGAHTLEVEATLGAATSAPQSASWTIVSPDGSGTLTTPTARVAAESAHRTLDFTYAAAAGGTSAGTVSLLVPPGWSPPSTSQTAAGYTTASAGTVSVAGQRISVSGLSLAAAQTVTIAYGSRAAGGPGAIASDATGSESWAATEESLSTGTLTALAASPLVSAVAEDGSGSVTVSKTRVHRRAHHQTLRFRYTVAAGGIDGGELTLAVPKGWSAPSRKKKAPGYVTASAGKLAISGRTIAVSGLTKPAGGKITITYGSRAHRGPGAKAPAKRGKQLWRARERSLATSVLSAVLASPWISVSS